MAKRLELEITNGALAGKRYVVQSGGLRLGRSSSNDIHIPDEELSRNHCLFERVGDNDVRLTDLASANGTMVNGKSLGNEPIMLKDGDLVEVGTTKLVVVDAAKPMKPADVDLGLGNGAGGKSGRKRRSPFANVLWAFAILLALGAIYMIGTMPMAKTEAEPQQAIDDSDNPPLKEVYYEKVEANSEGIFRYEMTFTEDGVLKATVDDVPKENRHLVKSELLSPEARAMLGEILSFKAIRDIDREYIGPDTEPPTLTSWTLRVVYANRVRRIRIANMAEPEQFRAVRERLEAFSKNQLGIWALQYSRDKLVKLAEEAAALAKGKWDDREVQYGNLYGAIVAYKEAVFYLETVNPKPDCFAVAQKGLDQAVAELDRRYREQRFIADRALKIGQWPLAKRELTILMEMVPDRNDERYREASAKLADVEARIKGGK